MIRAKIVKYCAALIHIDVKIVELYKKVCWLGGVTAECNQDDPALITADTTHTVSHVTRGPVKHYTLPQLQYSLSELSLCSS